MIFFFFFQKKPRPRSSNHSLFLYEKNPILPIPRVPFVFFANQILHCLSPAILLVFSTELFLFSSV